MKKIKVIGLSMLLLTMMFVFAACTKSLGTVNFFVDGKKVGSSSINSKYEYKLPEEPKKPGYRFIGWYEEFGRISKNFKNGSKKNVHARFEPILTETNIEGEAPNKRTILDVAQNIPKKENLTFSGWYTDPDYKTPYKNQNVDKIYGKFMAKVTYHNGYEVLKEELVDVNNSIKKPEINSDFIKEYMDEEDVSFMNGNYKFDFDQKITKNTVVDVKWRTKTIKDAHGQIEGYKPVANGDGTYRWEERGISDHKWPVLSLPGKATIDVGGTKEEKTFTGINFGQINEKTEKIIVGKGIKYISGLMPQLHDTLKEVVLPNTLKVIENSFNYMFDDAKVNIPESVETIIHSFWKNSQLYPFEGLKHRRDNVKIPASVKHLALMPTNLEFESNDVFEKENDMIFKKDGGNRTLVAINLTKEYEQFNIPEGVTHVQVGIFNHFDRFAPSIKRIKFPSTFKGVKYNPNENEYPGYSNPNEWLFKDGMTVEEIVAKYKDTLDVEEKVSMYTIVNKLSRYQLVEFNLKEYPSGLEENLFYDSALQKNMSEDELLDKTLFSAKKEVGQPVTVKAFVNHKYVLEKKFRKAISSKKSGEKITLEEIKSELGLGAEDVLLNSLTTGNPIENDEILLESDINFYAELSTTKDGIEIEEDGDGNAVVSGFNKDNAELDEDTNLYNVYIPKMKNGKKVIGIKEGAFKGNKLIQNVYTEANLEYIADEAFMDAEHLRLFTTNSNNLKKIGKRAFQDSGLEKITLPLRNLEEIGEFAFKCRNLEYFKVPEEEKSDRMVKSIYGVFGIGKYLSERLEKGKFYLSGADAHSYDGSENYTDQSSQIVRYIGKTVEKVKKNATSEETNDAVVFDFELYAQAARGVRNDFSGMSLQLGTSIRHRAKDYPVLADAPVMRYTIKKGAVSYLPAKADYIPDGEDGKGEIINISFGVIKKVEEGAFTDMEAAFGEIDTNTGKAKYFQIVQPDHDPDKEVDQWVFPEDFNDNNKFEDGWWNGIKRADSNYNEVIGNALSNINYDQYIKFY